MAWSSVAHLTRRGDVFYFRRAIPKHLVTRFGRSEIKLSLQTEIPTIAKRRCRMLSNAFEQLVDRVEAMGGVSREQIEGLIKAYFAQGWAKVREVADFAPHDPAFDLNAEAESAEAELPALRLQATTRHYDRLTKAAAHSMLDEYGYAAEALDKEDFETLCQGILRARIEQHRLLISHLRGRFDETAPLDPLFRGMAEPDLPSIPGELSPQANATNTLATVVEAYLSSPKLKKMPPKTIAQKRGAFRLFAEHLGSDQRVLSSITVDEVRSFSDLLPRLPKNRSKHKAYAGKSLKQLAALDLPADQCLSPATAVKEFSAVKAFFDWAAQKKYLTASPAVGMSVDVEVDKKNARHPFSKEQLTTLFASPMYRGCKSAAQRRTAGPFVIRDSYYWIPLVALFSGMRLGEIAQMLVDDIRQSEQGAWYFDVTKGEDNDGDENNEKTLKTASSERKVPVHPTLIDLGFLGFVEDKRKANPKGRIFIDIQKGQNGYYSHNASKWFARYFTEIGIKTKKVTFHSFRHCFADALREAEVDDSRMKALLGHSDDSTTAIYGSKALKPDLLASSLAKVSYPIDLSHLADSAQKG